MSLRIVRIPSGAYRRRRREEEARPSQTYPFTVEVTDAASQSDSAELAIRIRV